jgi:L-alanine-DL-glutamate epimerase-like enolase superfamily enzyme
MARIVQIDTWATEWVGFVRVVAEDGAEGFGQVAPYNADLTCAVLHRQVAPHVLGREALRPHAAVQDVLEAEHKFPGSYLCRALGGVDTALFDLLGKVEGKSVCELLGGRLHPYPAYASSMRRDIAPRDEARRLAELQHRHGFTAFKFRIGKECGRDRDEWPGRTEEIVPAVRAALGEDARLLVDANSCYTPHRAIEVGRFLQGHGVIHLEEPCPYWELDWTAEVREALDLDVTGGEQDWSLAQWRRIVTLPAVDVVQPDVLYVGGIARALEVAALARGAGLPCTPHSANLSLVTLFTVHLLCAIPNAGPYVELSIEDETYYPWQAGLYEPALWVDDGLVHVPDGPGWGVELSPAWLDGAARQTSTIT